MSRRFSPVTGRGFDRLLRSLDEDPDRAEARYAHLRRRLVWFFERRGLPAAEDHADETLTRVAQKLEAGERVEDVGTYSLGVARFVRLESLRQVRETPLDLETVEPSVEPRTPVTVDEPDDRLPCMQRCLAACSAEERELILTYYLGESRGRIDLRRALAARLGIPVATLRIRAFRTRQRLLACVTTCLERVGTAMDGRLASVQNMALRGGVRPKSA